MAGIDVEKLLKHLKKALDFLQKIPVLTNPIQEWGRKELVELLTKDMVDFENVAKAPMSHLNEGEAGEETGAPGQTKRGLTRSKSKPFRFNERLKGGELTIEIGANGEVIIKQGSPSSDSAAKSHKAQEPEPEVDFGADDDLYDDTASVPDESDKPCPVEKPKNIGAKFGSYLKAKAKVLSPLPDRKKAAFSGKLTVKAGVLSKPTSKFCAIKQGHLYCGGAENAPSDLKVRLAGCSVTELDSKELPFAFELTSAEGNNFLLAAGSQEERDTWVRQLKEGRDGAGKDRAQSDADTAAGGAGRGKSPSLSASLEVPVLMEPEPELEPEPEPEPEPVSIEQTVSELENALEDVLTDEGESVCEKKGWLKRVGNLTSHKVWVVVSGPQLTIYRDDKEQDVKEEYSVYGAKLSTKSSTIKVTMTDIKKGVALAPVYKASLPDAKWLQVLAKAIQAEEDIYEEYISPESLGLGQDASLKKGIGTSFRQTMKVGFSMFSRSEEVQGNPTHAGTLWYLEPKTDRYVQNYFSVVGDFLVHYRSQGDKQVLGRINLSKCYGMWLGPYGPMKNVLCLSHDGKKIHFFSVADPDEVGDWLESLGKALVDSTWCSHYNDVTNQEVSPGISVRNVFQVIYGHKSEAPNELALARGDMVHVTEFNGNAWLCEELDKTMRGTGKVGFVTGAYLAAAYAAY